MWHPIPGSWVGCDDLGNCFSLGMSVGISLGALFGVLVVLASFWAVEKEWQ